MKFSKEKNLRLKKNFILRLFFLVVIFFVLGIWTEKYDLLKNGLVNIIIYDMLGNVVNNLVNDNQSSGYKSVQWDATNNQGEPVSAGVYLYKILAGDFVNTKKMILLKWLDNSHFDFYTSKPPKIEFKQSPFAMGVL